MKKHLDIHIDGSCLDHGRDNARGGWAFAITREDSTSIIHEQNGKLRAGTQTNNRAELEAVYQALLWIDEFDDGNTNYCIYSDSKFVVDGLIGASARNAYRDMWESIEKLCAKHLGKINAECIDAHQKYSEKPKHILNCRCDKSARTAANNLLISPVEIKEVELQCDKLL